MKYWLFGFNFLFCLFALIFMVAAICCHCHSNGAEPNQKNMLPSPPFLLCFSSILRPTRGPFSFDASGERFRKQKNSWMTLTSHRHRPFPSGCHGLQRRAYPSDTDGKENATSGRISGLPPVQVPYTGFYEWVSGRGKGALLFLWRAMGVYLVLINRLYFSSPLLPCIRMFVRCTCVF